MLLFISNYTEKLFNKKRVCISRVYVFTFYKFK